MLFSNGNTTYHIRGTSARQHRKAAASSFKCVSLFRTFLVDVLCMEYTIDDACTRCARTAVGRSVDEHEQQPSGANTLGMNVLKIARHTSTLVNI